MIHLKTICAHQITEALLNNRSKESFERN